MYEKKIFPKSCPFNLSWLYRGAFKYFSLGTCAQKIIDWKTNDKIDFLIFQFPSPHLLSIFFTVRVCLDRVFFVFLIGIVRSPGSSSAAQKGFRSQFKSLLNLLH